MSAPSPLPYDGCDRCAAPSLPKHDPHDGVNTAMVLACIVGGLALAMILIGWV